MNRFYFLIKLRTYLPHPRVVFVPFGRLFKVMLESQFILSFVFPIATSHNAKSPILFDRLYRVYHADL